MNAKVYRQWIMPTVVPLGVIVLTGILIVGIGELLLALKAEEVASELHRVELWVGTVLAIAVIVVGALLAMRPKGTLGKLDEEIAIGSRPMLAEPLPPVDIQARRGPLGTEADIQPGFMLYARNGALARVIEMLPNVQESYGHLRRGLIYAAGLSGAADEMWIPVEAISAVYPETRSAFLAIAGDEVEYLGWHQPPAAFRRTKPREEQKLY